MDYLFSLLNSEIDTTDKYKSWFDSVSKLVIGQLKNEKIRDQVEMENLKTEIDNMKNTLSWRLTSPIRNSHLLKKIIKLFIKRSLI